MRQNIINNLGIPPLAGLCSYAEAAKVGYSVEQNVELLKRYNYVERALNQILAAHLACTPEWEVKCALSLHLWLDAEHSAALRKRVGEIREPPLQLDRVPDRNLQAWIEETLRAETTIELLVGVYQVAKPALVRCLSAHLAATNPLIDHPTCRVLRQIRQEEEEMVAWGAQAIAALTQPADAAAIAHAWETHLNAFLDHAGGITGAAAMSAEQPLPTPRWDGTPYVMNSMPQRDDRFTDSFDQSHWKYVDVGLGRDPTMAGDEIAFALLYRRLREMDVPEYMAPMIFQIKDRPWEYYVDLSRQAWDEARHAMMGEVGLYANGMAFYEYPIELEGSVALNRAFTPLEAHVVLWGIEQGLMRREDGKRFELELAQAAGEPLVAAFQDYDWADEVLHAQIGRRWLLPEYGNMEQLQAAANELKERWFVEMNKLLPSASPQEWWPDFVADLRQRRTQQAAATNGESQ